MPATRRLLPLLALAVLGAACGSSKPKGPPALLYVSTKDGDYALFGVDARGKHSHRLSKERGGTAPPQLFFQVEPAWSPDGRQIAFASARDETTHIYVMSWDGTGTRSLTSATQNDTHPSWSPDGKRIVFAREGALFVVPAAGGGAVRVGHGKGDAADPSWSPDGKSVAYDYRAPGYRTRELYVMDADGTHVRQLTKLNQVSSLPAWSRDGKRLAFQSDARYGHDEIYTIGLDGKGMREVTTSTTDAFQPTYAPDGALTYARDGSIWTTDAQGKEVEVIKGGNSSSPAWRPSQPG